MVIYVMNEVNIYSMVYSYLQKKTDVRVCYR